MDIDCRHMDRLEFPVINIMIEVVKSKYSNCILNNLNCRNAILFPHQPQLAEGRLYQGTA